MLVLLSKCQNIDTPDRHLDGLKGREHDYEVLVGARSYNGLSPAAVPYGIYMR